MKQWKTFWKSLINIKYLFLLVLFYLVLASPLYSITQSQQDEIIQLQNELNNYKMTLKSLLDNLKEQKKLSIEQRKEIMNLEIQLNETKKQLETLIEQSNNSQKSYLQLKNELVKALTLQKELEREITDLKKLSIIPSEKLKIILQETEAIKKEVIQKEKELTIKNKLTIVLSIGSTLIGVGIGAGITYLIMTNIK